MRISPDSNRELLQSGFSFLLPFVRMLSVNSMIGGQATPGEADY